MLPNELTKGSSLHTPGSLLGVHFPGVFSLFVGSVEGVAYHLDAFARKFGHLRDLLFSTIRL